MASLLLACVLGAVVGKGAFPVADDAERALIEAGSTLPNVDISLATPVAYQLDGGGEVVGGAVGSMSVLELRSNRDRARR